MKQYKKNWTYFNKKFKKRQEIKVKCHFWIPALFFSPPIRKQSLPRRRYIYSAILCKTREAANHAIAHKGKFFLSNHPPS